MTPVPGYEQAVSAWAAHLRAGGTATWSAWRRDHPVVRPEAPVLHPLPHGHQLELVRRLNLAAGSGRADASAPELAPLADRVLATAPPGRGLLDVPLPWEAPPRFGTPPREPDRLPTEELLRLATGVLAHLLPTDPPAAKGASPTPWPTPWRRRFLLHGSPGTVGALRTGLLTQGLAETSWRPTHVVVARPLEVMMAEHWAASVRAGGTLKWTRIWQRAAAAGRLPAPVDVPALAAGLAGRRREPLHVVAAGGAAEAVHLVTRLLGARPFDLPPTGDPALVDLLRRVNRLSGLVRGPEHVRPVGRTLLACLDAEQPWHVDARTSGLLTPREALAWARTASAAAAGRLREAGYPVHGDPGALAPAEHRRAGTVDRDRTLDLALEACLRTWQLGGTP